LVLVRLKSVFRRLRSRRRGPGFLGADRLSTHAHPTSQEPEATDSDAADEFRLRDRSVGGGWSERWDNMTSEEKVAAMNGRDDIEV
jgi:hypothetical protein